jgi:hypothetical protein
VSGDRLHFVWRQTGAANRNAAFLREVLGSFLSGLTPLGVQRHVPLRWLPRPGDLTRVAVIELPSGRVLLDRPLWPSAANRNVLAIAPLEDGVTVFTGIATGRGTHCPDRIVTAHLGGGLSRAPFTPPPGVTVNTHVIRHVVHDRATNTVAVWWAGPWGPLLPGPGAGLPRPPAYLGRWDAATRRRLGSARLPANTLDVEADGRGHFYALQGKPPPSWMTNPRGRTPAPAPFTLYKWSAATGKELARQRFEAPSGGYAASLTRTAGALCVETAAMTDRRMPQYLEPQTWRLVGPPAGPWHLEKTRAQPRRGDWMVKIGRRRYYLSIQYGSFSLINLHHGSPPPAE